MINDEVAYKRMIKCNKVVELRNVGEYLCEAGFKLNNKINKI
jgi:hypothetical protein